jgi:aminocarboxymuconate-semialdehyde decarboxylase
MTIDIHTHVVPRDLPDMTARPGGPRYPVLGNVGETSAEVLVNGANMRTVPSTCWHVPDRLAEMDATGISRQVLSPMPVLLTYWAQTEDARYYTDAVNDGMAEMAAQAPDRLAGFGAVPLQDPRAAIDTIPRLVQLGLRGIELGSNIAGSAIGDPSYFDFFRELADAGLAVFVHAMDPVALDRLVGGPSLDNLVGFPVDIGLAAASVITGGLLQAVPNLRIAFSHGGGIVGMLLPRIRMGWHLFGSESTRMPVDPEAVARSMWFDTLVYDPRTLRYLIDLLGEPQLAVGSDFPFVVMENPPGKILASPELDGALTETALRVTNAERFLGEV